MKQAQDALRSILNDQWATEQSRLRRIQDALRTNRSVEDFAPSMSIPENAPPLMRDLARKSETNYLPLLLDTFGQVMKVDGYQSAMSDEAAPSWSDWQRNRMDARQTGLTRAALQYGAAYAMALAGRAPGVSGDVPRIQLFSPRRMTALYQDAEFDEWPMLAVYREGSHFVLVDEEQSFRFGAQSQRTPWGAASSSWHAPTLATLGEPAWLTPIEAQPHGMGFVPVVRYRDRMLLEGEEQLGIVEPLLTIQERINETTFKGMVSMHFEAFRQRYVLGWVPKNESEELKAGAALMWYMKENPDDVKLGSFETGDPKNYLEPRAQAVRDFAAIGQIPAQALGVDGISNISDATLAGLEAAKNRKAGEIMTSLGESHEQLMRLCGRIRGDDVAAGDYESEVRWRDFEARSFAAMVDGLVKLVGQQQGILPPEMAVEMVPGITQQQARRAKTAQQRQRIAGIVDGLTGAVSK